MGASSAAVTRVVLDTNTVVSALLFSGTAARLVPLWRFRRIVPLVTKSILEEYVRVLAYPKFHLSAPDIRLLIEEEVMPYVEAVRITRRLRPPVADRDDHKFLNCAVAGRAEFLITGDRELQRLGAYRGVGIIPVAEFLTRADG
jgi:hypothetical protein